MWTPISPKVHYREHINSDVAIPVRLSCLLLEFCFGSKSNSLFCLPPALVPNCQVFGGPSVHHVFGVAATAAWRLPIPNMPLEDEGSVNLLLYCIRDNTLQLWSCSEQGGQYYYSMNGRYSGTLINFLSTDTIVGAVGGPWEQRNANFMANVLDQQPTPLLQAKHPSSNGLKRWKRNLCCKMPVTNYYENLKWRTAACWLF